MRRRPGPARKPLKRTPLRRQARLSGAATRTGRTGKYGVAREPARFYKGILYDSLLETRYAQRLDLLRQSAAPEYRVANVERQVSVKLEVNGKLICRHIIDFRVTYADGRVEFHETKGFETGEWRIKYALFRALYPHLTYRVIRKV